MRSKEKARNCHQLLYNETQNDPEQKHDDVQKEMKISRKSEALQCHRLVSFSQLRQAS